MSELKQVDIHGVSTLFNYKKAMEREGIGIPFIVKSLEWWKTEIPKLTFCMVVTGLNPLISAAQQSFS